MARRPKRSKKQSGDSDDAFIARILQLLHWSQSHQQVLTVAVVVLLIAGGAGLYYTRYEKTLAQEADQSMEQITESLSLKDNQGAESQLVTFLQRFGSTAYAGEARLLLGQIYLQANEPAKAVAVLEPIGASPSAPVDFQAAQLLGVAYEQENQWQKAEHVYLVLAGRAKLDFQVRAALASAARLRAEHGDRSGAVELYRRILDSLGTAAPDRGVYQMRIDELTAKAAAEASPDTQPSAKKG